jgi:hypothetical protein
MAEGCLLCPGNGITKGKFVLMDTPNFFVLPVYLDVPQQDSGMQIVPKRHIQDFRNLNEEELADYRELAKRVEGEYVRPLSFEHIGLGYGKNGAHAREFTMPAIGFDNFKENVEARLRKLPEGHSFGYGEGKIEDELTWQFINDYKGALFFRGEGRQGLFVLDGPSDVESGRNRYAIIMIHAAEDCLE